MLLYWLHKAQPQGQFRSSRLIFGIMILVISFNLAGFGSNELEIISYWTDLTIKLKKKKNSSV